MNQRMHQPIAQRLNLSNEQKYPQTYQLACPRNFPLHGRSNLTTKVYWPRCVPWTIYNARMEAMCREILATTVSLILAQRKILSSSR